MRAASPLAHPSLLQTSKPRGCALFLPLKTLACAHRSMTALYKNTLFQLNQHDQHCAPPGRERDSGTGRNASNAANAANAANVNTTAAAATTNRGPSSRAGALGAPTARGYGAEAVVPVAEVAAAQPPTLCRLCCLPRSDDNPLVMPCCCSGEQAFVHSRCLQKRRMAEGPWSSYL